MKRLRVLAVTAGVLAGLVAGRARGGLLPARAVRAHAAVGHARAGGRLDPARLRAGARLPRRLPDRLPAAGVGRARTSSSASRSRSPACRTGSRRSPTTPSPTASRAAGARRLDRRGGAGAAVRRHRDLHGHRVGRAERGRLGRLPVRPVEHRVVLGRRGSRRCSRARPLSFRAQAAASNVFIGVRAADPPGGQADIRCALDAQVQADGSVDRRRRRCPATGTPHPTVPENAFPRPGRVDVRRPRHRRGRGRGLLADGLRRALVRAAAIEVRSDFRRKTGGGSRARARSGRASASRPSGRPSPPAAASP